MIRSTRLGAALVALLLSAATPLAAQSLTSVQGLGYPLLPVEARIEALGGLGIGLQGLSPSLLDPAAPAGVQGRGAVVSVAAVEQTATLGEESEQYGATRFPLIQVLYPMRGVVVTAGYGGYLDQSWAIVREATESTAGSTVSYHDFVRSTGGVGQVQLGAAVPIGDRLAIGVALGAHTGRQRLQHQRTFDSTSLGDLEPFRVFRTVRYKGPMARVGVRWDPVDVVRLAASVKWAGSLQADSAEGPVSDTEYDLPLEIAGGVSAYLGPSLLANLSGRWTGWESTGVVGGVADPSLTPSAGRDTWEIGGGLELDDPGRRVTRAFPVRLGFQYRQLPFSFVDEAPTEWWASGGVGMRVGPDADTPLLRVDLTVQRGERTTPAGPAAGDLTESAWRFALSLAIFGT